jgi:hypothetical protein
MKRVVSVATSDSGADAGTVHVLGPIPEEVYA